LPPSDAYRCTYVSRRRGEFVSSSAATGDTFAKAGVTLRLDDGPFFTQAFLVPDGYADSPQLASDGLRRISEDLVVDAQSRDTDTTITISAPSPTNRTGATNLEVAAYSKPKP
jgi:hypothetical protein